MKIKLLFASVLLTAAMLRVSPVHAQQRTDVTTFSGETTVNHTEDGHRYKIRLNGSKVTEMYVDDKKVPEEDYSKYDAMIKRILVQIEKDRQQAEKDRAQAEKDREQAEKDRTRAELDRQQAGKDREEAERHRKHADEDRLQAEQHRQQAQKDRDQAEKDRAQANKDRERAEQDRLQADKDRTRAEKDREQAEKDRARAEIDRQRAAEDRKLVEALIEEVVNEKLVADSQSLKSLILDDEEFSVNGVKQPASLHNKFKAKYLKGTNKRINFRNSDGFRGISID